LSPTGTIGTASNWHFVSKTTDVAGQVGTQFGIEFRIDGNPVGDDVTLHKVLKFPPQGIRNPNTGDTLHTVDMAFPNLKIGALCLLAIVKAVPRFSPCHVPFGTDRRRHYPDANGLRAALSTGKSRRAAHQTEIHDWRHLHHRRYGCLGLGSASANGPWRRCDDDGRRLERERLADSTVVTATTLGEPAAGEGGDDQPDNRDGG
jgi:hypothetical protein